MDYQQELSSIDTPQLPEVIVDGHKVAGGSKETMSEIYEILNMANLAKMRKVMVDQSAQGWVRAYNFNISPAGEIVKLEQKAQAISLINDGPAVIQVGINSRDHLNTVLNGQAFNLNFKNHVLEWLFVRCVAGVATARAAVSG
jgi:hypothetical protein